MALAAEAELSQRIDWTYQRLMRESCLRNPEMRGTFLGKSWYQTGLIEAAENGLVALRDSIAEARRDNAGERREWSDEFCVLAAVTTLLFREGVWANCPETGRAERLYARLYNCWHSLILILGHEDVWRRWEPNLKAFFTEFSHLQPGACWPSPLTSTSSPSPSTTPPFSLLDALQGLGQKQTKYVVTQQLVASSHRSLAPLLQGVEPRSEEEEEGWADLEQLKFSPPAGVIWPALEKEDPSSSDAYSSDEEG